MILYIDTQEETKKDLRRLELDHASLKVTCQTRKEEIEKLQEQIRLLRSGLGVDVGGAAALPPPSAISPSCPTTYCRLMYIKRCELIRRDASAATQDSTSGRYCRVMAYNETHGMLVISQVRCPILSLTLMSVTHFCSRYLLLVVFC